MLETKKNIVVVATGWGPKYGGINSFNYDLCRALGPILDDEYRLICAVPYISESEINENAKFNIHFCEIGFPLSSPTLAFQINELVNEKYPGETIWWIGHDIYSGEIVNYGKNKFAGQSAVFQHMAYRLYHTYKTYDGNHTIVLDEKQRKIAEECDTLIGVGPLLYKHAKSFKDDSVFLVIPGLQKIDIRKRNKDLFDIILFGRMEEDDDVIKQSSLGAEIFHEFSKRIRDFEQLTKTNLTVVGLPCEDDKFKNGVKSLKDIVKNDNIIPMKFTENRESLFKELTRQHACFMLSLHEGFGLAGWEAIAAEVPLIVSEQSGLYELIYEEHAELLSKIYPVDVREDKKSKRVDKALDHLIKICLKPEEAAKKAKTLKQTLMEQGYTWENSARSFANALNIPIKKIACPLEKETCEGEVEKIGHIEIPPLYVKWIKETCAYMNVEKFSVKEPIRVSLPEIFVPLFGYDPIREKSEKDIGREEYRPIDIEKLIAKYDSLLIIGQAGSGKTTLLRHITYSLAQKAGIKGLEGYMPILIYLKDLKEYLSQAKSNGTEVDNILAYHLRNISRIIDANTIIDFCQSGKVIFLLDGLDEIDEKYRDIIVKTFSDFRCGFENVKVVISSRPYGVKGEAINRLGNMKVEVHALNSEQKKDFIENWFKHIYIKSTVIGEERSSGMLSEINAHPAIEELSDTPLMLTAVCILYYNNVKLPAQRAELYKVFVENLLSRRFKDDTVIQYFLEELAFSIHEKRSKSMPHSFAIDILQKYCPAEKDEKSLGYTERIEKLFNTIELNSGLLKLENGGHTFWHLTFQEFFTAKYILRTNTQFDQAIQPYWDDEWYLEVIKLYIGYLSIDNIQWVKKLINNILEGDVVMQSRLLIAGEAWKDIPVEKRIVNPLVKDLSAQLMNLLEILTHPKSLFRAGEIIGALGDPRDLESFVFIEGGEYKLEDIGNASIKPFEIGRYPVANDWFAGFIKEDGYKNEEYWSDEGKKWLEYTGHKQPKYWDEHKWKCPNSPVVGVCWYEADAFCRWLTIIKNDGYTYRLPTEQEWQAAAAGKKGRKYPWGNKMDKERCNNRETEIEKTSPVGIFINGRTSEEVYDLSGNVWEWTGSGYHQKREMSDFRFDEKLNVLWEKRNFEEYLKLRDDINRQLPVVRGGSWSIAEGCRCAFRFSDFPGFRDFDIGFRCART